jgi:hypothetical protein
VTCRRRSAAVKLSGIDHSNRVGSPPTPTPASLRLAREIDYAGAVALAASRRVSVIGELLGRWIDSPGHIVPVSAAHPGLSGVETIRLTPGTSSLQVITLVPGVKWNLSDTWILAANVSIPLTTGGLTAPFTPSWD